MPEIEQQYARNIIESLLDRDIVEQIEVAAEVVPVEPGPGERWQRYETTGKTTVTLVLRKKAPADA